MQSISPAVGIDVCKARLDVRLEGRKPLRVKNALAEVEAFAASLPPGSLIALERSGGYERLAVHVLRAAGHDVRAFNPLSVKRFGQSIGKRAKTDELDAQTLAVAARTLPPPQVKSQEREQLNDHARHVHRLKRDMVKVVERLEKPGLAPCLVASLEREKAFLEAEAKSMQKLLEGRMKASSSADDYALALSVPGVGAVTACAVVTELPDDLSGLTPRQIASYAGLAPLDDSSGKREGPKGLGRGNTHIKTAMYTPALRASFKDEWAKDLYARLRAKGKSHQTAIVAVMRRLLLRIVAVLKRGTPWEGVLQRAT